MYYILGSIRLCSEISVINGKLYKDVNAETISLSLKDAAKHVCDNYVGLNSSARGRFNCAEGWYDYDLIKSADDYCSGIINGHTKSVTYSCYRSRGADAVLKKLGEAQFAEFSVSVNDIHPSMTWTAPGKIIRAGLTGAGSTTDPGGNSGPSVSCTFEGNVVTVSLWKFGGSCNAQGFVVYE